MGIDVENEKCVSLIQVATNERVYLLDLINLSKLMKEAEVERISNEFFCNERVIKIGKYFHLQVNNL